MRATRRSACAGLAAWGLILALGPACAADVISVTFGADEAEIITKDLKRIRLAQGAEAHFNVLTNYIELVFKNDLTLPRQILRLAIVTNARRVLSEYTADEAVGDAALLALIAAVNRQIAYMGVAVRDHTLRYVLVPSL